MRLPSALTFAVVIGAISPFATSSFAAVEEGVIKASCVTKAGLVRYREDLPPGTPPEKRLEIAAKYRDALCVFLKSEPVEAGVSETRDPALAALSGSNTEDLASALAFLSPGGSVGSSYGGAFDESMHTFLKSENAFTDQSKSVNLTVGVYADASSEDVLAHWGYIMKNTHVLGKMTPSIDKVGDVVVLSVEGVSDTDAAKVCQEAEKVASGCLAVY